MRKLLRGLLGLIFLCALAIAFILGAAHWQIRHIEPELPTWAQLDVALDEPDGPVALSYINTASQTTQLGALGHPAILIQWQDGRQFLIDTGMPPEAARAFGEPLELLGAGPTTTFGSIASQLGLNVNSIKGIAFTHLHNDHTDGLPELCDAQSEPATVYQAALQRDELNYGTRIGFAALETAVCPRQVLGGSVIKTIPGFPGLVAVSLGGHTPGSTMYAARVGADTWVFSGDISNSRQALLEDQPKPWWYSTLVVPEHTERTAQLRRWLRLVNRQSGVAVLPAHDVMAMAEAGLPAWPDATP